MCQDNIFLNLILVNTIVSSFAADEGKEHGR